MKKVPVTLTYLAAEDNPLPHPVLVSKQIDGLREVLRRMKAAKSTSLEPLISKKLDQFARR